MRSQLRMFAALCAGVVLGGVGVGIAAIPDSGSGVITACMTKTGTIRVIDYQAGKRCRSIETLLTWNQRGVSGATGPQGPAGPTGPAGNLSCADELRIQNAVPDFAVTAACAPTPISVFDNLGTYTGGPGSGTMMGGSNFGNPPGFNDVAAGFDVGASGVRLSSITLRLRAMADPHVTVSLVTDEPLTGFGDGTSEPNLTNVVESWSLSATATYPTEYTVRSVIHPVLTAGTRYWVMLTAQYPYTAVFWQSSDLLSTGQLSAERNQLYVTWGYPPTAWFSRVNNQTYAMRVIGTAL